VVGTGHLQITLRTGSTLRDAIGFGFGNRAGELLTGAKVHVAFVPQIDNHRGVKKVRLRVRELVVPGAQAAADTQATAEAQRTAATRS
jgi:hypothetical protein